MIAIPAPVVACAGKIIESGLQADPCCFCLRRSVDALIGEPFPPAVQWVETSDFVGYVCSRQLKIPMRRPTGESA